MNRNHDLSVHFSSARSDWPTPAWLFNALDKEFHFTLDPCSTHQNAKCKKHFTIMENGLSQSWAGERVFMNPPYGRQIGIWMEKAHERSGSFQLIGPYVMAPLPTVVTNRTVNGNFIRTNLEVVIFRRETNSVLKAVFSDLAQLKDAKFKLGDCSLEANP